MHRDALLARIAELTALREQALGQANAANGAIQECHYWLAKLAGNDAAAAQCRVDAAGN